MNKIGVVTIGRNEGERLIHCLDSLLTKISNNLPIVYVDSGSTDKSCEVASKRGVEVVNLDTSVPFTAARARNAGFKRLFDQHPEVEYVQFIDGDCELVEGWLEVAAETLDANPNVVAVCGWRRELYPDRSIYNRICDVEWHMGLVGATLSFGGDVMIRTEAFAAVDGYDNSIIAAEDDELSVRLRQAGGTILRIDRDSTWHDADMYSVFQWWQRAKRCGYAYAQVSHRHGGLPERKFVKEVWRTWLWGGIVPLMILTLTFSIYKFSWLAFGYYPLKALRVTYKTKPLGFSWLDSIAWGLSCSVSAFPGLLGVTNFYLDHWGNNQHKIIEYKKPHTSV